MILVFDRAQSDDGGLSVAGSSQRLARQTRSPHRDRQMVCCDQEVASIGFETNWETTPPRVVLSYCDDDRNRPVRLPVTLQSTRTRHDGHRWWFTCPIDRGGAACGRRCGNLYLPGNQLYFGCRHCYELTYRSSQEAHLEERLWNRFGIPAYLRC